MKNYAGVENIDLELIQELTDAGITFKQYPFLKDGRNEVNTSVVGVLGHWIFTRAWVYWVAKGDGISPEYAEPFHETWGNEVRVDGHCGCPSPVEWKHGFAIDTYHIDTSNGLKAFADLLKKIELDTIEKYGKEKYFKYNVGT
jgi:hypothetical protein